MVDELDDRLSNEDLQDLAKYTVRLSRADTTMAAIRSLMTIDNPRAVAAVGASGVACVTGLKLGVRPPSVPRLAQASAAPTAYMCCLS